MVHPVVEPSRMADSWWRRGSLGLSPRAFRSIEVLCREKVKALVPEAYRLVAVEMHLHKALPNFFDELHRVRDRVEVYAAIDARLQSIGRPSKLGGGGNA
jgi:hypothetical protein